MQRLARITIIPFDSALRRIFNLQNVLCDRIPNISIYKLDDLHISSSKIVLPGFLVHYQQDEVSTNAADLINKYFIHLVQRID